MLLHKPGVSAQHKGPDGLSRNVEGRDQLILAKSSGWEHWRDRIKGITKALREGIAEEDDDQELLTVDKVPPEELKPFPHAQGLAVSLNYEHKSQEHKFSGTARGDKAARGKVAEVTVKEIVNTQKQKAKHHQITKEKHETNR